MRGTDNQHSTGLAGLSATLLFSLAGVAPSANAATPAPARNYIPGSVSMANHGAQSGLKVCVIGFSKQKTGLGVGPYTFDIPAFYLGRGSTDHAGTSPVAWRLATGNTSGVINAWEVGVDIVDLPAKPAAASSPSGNYINAGNLTFFVVKPPPAGFDCKSITYTYKNRTTGDINAPIYPYPNGLAEYSTYPVWDAGSKTYSDFMTVDTSNVDSFQIPLLVNLIGGSAAQPKRVAYFGNPVDSPLIDRKSMISGPTDAGGATSPFTRWLSTQKDDNLVAAPFRKLALSRPPYPYAMIQSPNDFLLNTCNIVPNTSPPQYVPGTCNLNGQLLNWNDPLNNYFDAELVKFFGDAFHDGGKARLSVMGDASGAFNSVPWTVQGYTFCPVYLKRDSRSLLFKSASYAATITLCNPLGQVSPLNGALKSGAITQIPAGRGQKQTATISLTAAQCTQAINRMGWNFGQPSSGWVGNITSVDCGADKKMTLDVLNGPGTWAAGKSTQKICISTGVVNSANNCPLANTSFADWVFSNIAWVGGTKWQESASQMVFGNDGAFNSWQPIYYSGPQTTIAQSIARNIVEAFNRGVANCNNVTMSVPAIKPAYCANMTALTRSEILPQAVKASDAYWSNQKNFYPAGAYQNYYAQYLHTMQLGAAPKTNIFALPQPIISAAAVSNQGVPMGMAYAFGFDETPDYLTATPATKIPNVPSKLDPIPSRWWPADAVTSVQIVIGD